ncbi:Gfo/Idh/MocA family protein [Vibrio spartinae]|uniref:Oxidoreductase YdgJ n=1 Tax=Vibrio spartinae TaxID=1918945 RepID=A0ABX6QX07_9VIBR|nr:Gfo/Idh/MocA family oxidoreductase [Vibrio spartinae]QMV13786.1 putative oxidoreductase YdgJ [Vibrio spartinae]
MKNINVAIIGFGFMGHEHLSMLKTIDGLNVIGISDIDKSQYEDVEASVKYYESNEVLFKDPEVDVVLISANNNQHLQLVKEAAKAGKDIICEKPVAMTVVELDEMIAVTKEHDIRFTVHHQRRLDKDYQITKTIFEEGLLGDVYLLKNSLYGFNGNMHDWHICPSEGGGMLYDWGVHLIDQILWMMPDAKIQSVYADMRNVINAEVDDYFKILLKFDNKVTAEIELGTYLLTDKNHDKWFERHWLISGNEGTAYVDGFNPQGKIVRTTRLLKNVSSRRTMTAAGPTRSFGPPGEGVLVTEPLPVVETEHRHYFENYVRAYHGQEEFLVDVYEARRVLHLMEIIRVAASTGHSQPFE